MPKTVKTDTLVKNLKEIEVQAERRVSKTDHDILYLTRQNRETGTNALDAISSLPEFLLQLNAQNLSTVDGRSVAIFINGVPASGNELRTYRPEEIAKVEYYPYAAGRFMAYLSRPGPVVDVIVRKRKDQFGSLYASAKNSLNVESGFNQLSLTGADSINRINANYNFQYQHSKGKEYNQIELPGKKVDYDGLTSISHSRNQNVSLSYQMYKKIDLFNVRGTFTSAPSHDINDFYAVDSTSSNIANQYKEGKIKQATGDAYYKHWFGRNTLSANIIGTYATNILDNNIYNDIADKNPDNLIRNYYDISTYSIKGIANFGMPFGKTNHFQCGAHYMFKNITQTYNYDRKEVRYQRLVGANASVNMGLNRHFAIYAYCGLSYFNFATGTQYHQRDWIFTPQIQVNYIINNCAYIRVSANQYRSSPGSGSYNTEMTYLLPLLAATGNPALKPYNNYHWEFTANWRLPDYKWNITLRGAQDFTNDLIATTFRQEDGMLVETLENIGHQRSTSANLNVQYRPWRWMLLSPRVLYNYNHYDTRSNRVRQTRWRWNANVYLFLKKVQIQLSASPKSNLWDGDIYTCRGGSYSASVSWKIKSFSLALDASHQYKYVNSIARIPGCQWVKSYGSDKRNTISVTVTYSLSGGRVRKHAQRDINWQDNDVGVVPGG